MIAIQLLHDSKLSDNFLELSDIRRMEQYLSLAGNLYYLQVG